ncbi:hypothetical protein QR680_000744 [Steinernema hermaphroditum]|uniref:Uncharacterized protein n=1 Tax=Steinernema hermaphroditum TaxID=289476 RepID=A0AA39GX95_9BILA|nr:hypothetical protein QR680_000744 [Steinernema hermaphroditum]
MVTSVCDRYAETNRTGQQQSYTAHASAVTHSLARQSCQKAPSFCALFHHARTAYDSAGNDSEVECGSEQDESNPRATRYGHCES